MYRCIFVISVKIGEGKYIGPSDSIGIFGTDNYLRLLQTFRWITQLQYHTCILELSLYGGQVVDFSARILF